MLEIVFDFLLAHRGPDPAFPAPAPPSITNRNMKKGESNNKRRFLFFYIY